MQAIAVIKQAVKRFAVFQTAAQSLSLRFRRIRYDFRILKKRVYLRLDRNRDAQRLMINVGGGNYCRWHWKTLDFSRGGYQHDEIFIDYRFDLTSGAPFPLQDGSVSFFYSAHTLEHIPQEFCQGILNEMHRSLKKGGALRISLPDYDLAYQAYRDQNILFFALYPGETLEKRFMDFLGTYHKGKTSESEIRKNFQNMDKTEFADFYTNSIPRESQKSKPGNHINWWNFTKTESMLRKAGFTAVYRSQEQKSHFKELRGKGRNTGFDSTHPELSFFVEALKS